MKKIVQRVISLFLIFGIVISPLITKAEDTETTHEAEKGTLRLNGVVADSVSVTAGSLVNDGDIQIIKTVSKTDTLGEYEVKFEVVGKNIPKTQTKKGRVVLMLDMSNSLSLETKKSIKEATYEFVADLESKNIKVGVIAFANKNTARIEKKFNDTSFSIADSYGYNSFVDTALSLAIGMLSDNSENYQQYAILVGDGAYDISNVYTNIKEAKKNFAKIKPYISQFFMIQYRGRYESQYAKTRDYIDKYIIPNHHYCINIASRYQSVKCENMNSYSQIYNEIKKQVETELGSSNIQVDSILMDTLGSNFGKSETADDVIKINIGEVTNVRTEIAKFNITINPNSEEGWHPTNNGFSITYTDHNGIQKRVGSSENPEVYWYPEQTDIESCSGEIKSPPITKTITNSYYSIQCKEGYTENGKKYESFTTAMKVNDLADGVKEFTLPSGAGFIAEVTLKTNIKCTYKFDTSRYNTEYSTLEKEISQLESEIENLKSSFNSNILESGDTARIHYIDSSNTDLYAFITLGEVEDTSSMKPVEEALYGKKNGDTFEVTIHDNINDTDEVLNVTITAVTKKNVDKEKELAAKTLELKSLKEQANEYLIVSNEMALKDYKDKFFSLQPTLGVAYKSGEKSVTNVASNIVDKEPKDGEKFNNKDEDPKCEGTEDTIKIDNRYVKVLNQTCTGNFWRIMNIEKICLNMKTGKTEPCTDSNKQLDGLNKHYTPLKLTEDTKKMMQMDGDIVIELHNAGYDESINVTLKECKVIGKTSDAYYREIDVTDPFLQKATNGQRKIGSNFKGEYDFVQIISPTIWDSNNPLYTFKLSKVDVASIENDTTNLGKVSYVGDDCYISNRKYVCTLPHQYKK